MNNSLTNQELFMGSRMLEEAAESTGQGAAQPVAD